MLWPLCANLMTLTITFLQDGDGDEKLKDSRGQAATRDVVQFVPFQQFSRNPQLLAKEVLREVPGQVCEYMSKAGQ